MATIAEALETAIRLHQSGDLAQAEDIYQQILRVAPRHVDALHLFGLVSHQLGRHEQAVHSISEALRYNPGFAQAHDNLGIVMRHLGRLQEAAACHRQAIQLDSLNTGSYLHLGEVLVMMGQLDEAEFALQRAVALQPALPQAHCSLGNVYHLKGRYDEAIRCYRHSLQLKPDFVKAHNDLGYSLQRQGKFEEAIACYREALQLSPNVAMVHANLGFVLVELEKLEEAEAVCRQGLRSQPDSAEILNSLGIALKGQGKLDEAVACYRRALQLKPDYADAHNNLGAVLQIQEKMAEAAASFREAQRLKPNSGMASTNLGHLLKAQGKFQEGVACYRRALELEPDYAPAHRDLASALAEECWMSESQTHFQQSLRLRPDKRVRMQLETLLPPLYESMDNLRFWRNRLIDNLHRLDQEGFRLDPKRECSEPLFYLAYQGCNDRDIQRDVARLYTCDPTPPPPVPNPSRKIQIGFISRHLKNHTIGRLMRGLIANLSREVFSVTVLSLGRHQDFLVDFIKQNCDRYVPLPLDAKAARQIVADLGLDVLFYTDVGMEGVSYSLAYSRLAPVQCVTWGHPLTTGSPAMDYFISSVDLDTEEAADHYTETLVRLKTLPIYYYHPPTAPQYRDRSVFGLPKDCHLYACPQSAFKFHPEFDEVLGQILRADPRGHLVLLEATHPHWWELLQQRFTRVIPDVVDRIRCLRRLTPEAFVELNAVSDVLLDPIHFGGGNTSYEGFSVGTPIVTLPSPYLRGRITYAQYKQMGVLDCVVGTPQEYVERALQLGTDPAYRARIREKILAANGALYENAAGVRELEEFLQQAVAKVRR